MIAAKSKTEDQSLPSSQICNLLEAEQIFVDENIAEDEGAERFKIPMLPNKLGETAFWKMHESGLRVLVDTMISKVHFHRLIQA